MVGVADRVDQVLRRQLGPGLQWESATSLRGRPGLELDSLDMVQLVMGLEEEFQLSVPDDACEDFDAVGDLARWLERQIDAKPALFA